MNKPTDAALKLTLAGALFFGFAGIAAADKLDDIKARGKLLVGNSETSPPFSSRENGKIVGYDIDLAARVAKRLGVTMEFVSVINSERIPALQQDRIDLAASGMTRADNRRHLIGFSLAYLVSPHTVIIRKDSGITAVKQMTGRKLALVRGASVDQELKEAVPTLEIAFFDTYADCFNALRDKKVAGFLADEVLLWAYAQKSGAPQDYMMIPDYDLPRTAGFGIKKDEPRLTSFVDQTLLELEKSGDAEKVFNTWFAPVKRPFTIKAE
jgi:polar amino acid transport system substrate-binding protein